MELQAPVKLKSRCLVRIAYTVAACGSTFEVMTLDEHDARLALVRRRTREGLRLRVETVRSQQAEGDCEVSVVLALNGVAVRVQRVDPVTGQQKVLQEIREDSDPAGM